MKNFLKNSIVLFIAFFAYLNSSSAAEYYVGLIRNYYIDDVNSVKVIETHTIENRSKDRTIKASNVEKFYIHTTTGGTNELNKSVDTLRVSVDSIAVDYTKVSHNDYIEISVKLPRDIKPGETLSIKAEYSNFGLLVKSGALLDFYAPGYSDDSLSKEVSNTRYTVDTYVNISKSLPQTNFTNPQPISEGSEGNYKKLYYSYESLIKEYIWVQIGKTQYYKFDITQNVSQSDSANSNYFDEYRIIVPRDIEEPHVYQKVVFTNISQNPEYVERDEDGNLHMIFKVKSTSETPIKISGYAEVGANDTLIDSKKVGLIDEVKASDWSTFLAPANYWEVNDPLITSTTTQVIGNNRNIYQASQSIYNFIINKIDYSKIKRFGLNERQGALKTLNGSAAVCMEYSDLFITMSRNAGIPTRAVFGYGYDSKIQNSDQEAHQWAQVYMPGYDNWMSVDVTWGEAGIKMDERNLNHFYTHVASKEPNIPALVEWKGYGSNTGLKAPDYVIDAVNEIPRELDLKTTQNVLSEFAKKNQDNSSNNFISEFFSENNNLFKPSGLLVIIGVIMMIVSVFGIARVVKQQ